MDFLEFGSNVIFPSSVPQSNPKLTIKTMKSVNKALTCYFITLIFNSEDRGEIFLRNMFHFNRLYGVIHQKTELIIHLLGPYF
jgi:hypothetical protein